MLLYLGFLGDTKFVDHHKDADRWQRTMGAYMHGVVPKYLPGGYVEERHGAAASFTMLVEAVALPKGTLFLIGRLKETSMTNFWSRVQLLNATSLQTLARGKEFDILGRALSQGRLCNTHWARRTAVDRAYHTSGT